MAFLGWCSSNHRSFLISQPSRSAYTDHFVQSYASIGRFVTLLVYAGYSRFVKCGPRPCFAPMQEDVNTSITVAVMTPHQYVSGFNGSIDGCHWRGKAVQCTFGFENENPGLVFNAGMSSTHSVCQLHNCTPCLPLTKSPLSPIFFRIGADSPK